MPIAPSVTINGLIRNRDTPRPFNVPKTRPAATPAAIPAPAPPPFCITRHPKSPLNAIIEPTLRSIPPATMITVIPSAMMLITAVCRITLVRFSGRRKLTVPSDSPRISIINVIKGQKRCI